MISNLYRKQVKPSVDQVIKHEQQDGVSLIEKAIRLGLPEILIDQAINVEEKTISLEAMYNFYKEQLACELLVYEAKCPQGYIFTIDPPAIFVQAIGGGANATFLNRLQGLAMKMLIQEGRIQNMKGVQVQMVLIGCLSNFSSTYEPTRGDLTRHIFTQKDWLRLRELEQERLSG